MEAVCKRLLYMYCHFHQDFRSFQMKNELLSLWIGERKQKLLCGRKCFGSFWLRRKRIPVKTHCLHYYAIHCCETRVGNP